MPSHLTALPQTPHSESWPAEFMAQGGRRGLLPGKIKASGCRAGARTHAQRGMRRKRGQRWPYSGRSLGGTFCSSLGLLCTTEGRGSNSRVWTVDSGHLLGISADDQWHHFGIGDSHVNSGGYWASGRKQRWLQDPSMARGGRADELCDVQKGNDVQVTITAGGSSGASSAGWRAYTLRP